MLLPPAKGEIDITFSQLALNKVSPVKSLPKMHTLSPTRRNHPASTWVRDVHGTFEGVGIREITLAHTDIILQLMGFHEPKGLQE